MQTHFRRSLLAAAMLTASLVATAVPATAAHVVTVTSPDDAGTGSFRDAVEIANGDPDVTVIEFAEGLTVELDDDLVFTGVQDITILGNGSTVSGATGDVHDDTWDGGLFVATGGGDLTVRSLMLADSFDNGLAVFLPEGDASFTLTLDKVTVDGAQFHGVLVDGQATGSYNTADAIQPGCDDPYAIDTDTEITLDIKRTTVTDAGVLAGDFDASLATGCPQDFDGLRVDQGGEGSITGTVDRSSFDENLADGIELDEIGDGDVVTLVTRSTFVDNGLTEAVECSAAYYDVDVDDRGDCDGVGTFVEDLDDGFDIDEAGDGDIDLTAVRLTVDGNRDEGLDLDEAGGGDILLRVDRLEAHGNNDEAVKASEEDGGSIHASLIRAEITEGDGDAVELEEEGSGDNNVTVDRVEIIGNGGEGLKVEEADDGVVKVNLTRAEITDNDGNGIEVEQEGNGVEGSEVTIERAVLTGNDAPHDITGVATVSMTRTTA